MTVSGSTKLKRQIRGLRDDLHDEVHDAVEETVDDMEDHAKRTIVEEDAVATTALYRGFEQTTVGRHNRTTYILKNVAPHAPVVEFGTGDYFSTSVVAYDVNARVPHYRAPSFSPQLVNAIREWILVKPAFRTEGPPEAAAGAIAARIAGEVDGEPSGTKPVPFMQKALSRYARLGQGGPRDSLGPRVRSAIRDAVRSV